MITNAIDTENYAVDQRGYYGEFGGAFIPEMLHPNVEELRKSYLDIMYDDVETGKAVLMQVLETAGQVNKAYLNAMVLQMFANCKSEEIIEIFKVAARNQKSRVYSIMSKIDAANANKYRAIGI